MKALTRLLLLLLSPTVLFGEAQLIQWGQTTPDPALLADNIEYFEKRFPFDGLVLSVIREDQSYRYGDTMYSRNLQKNWPLSWKVFSRNRADPNDYEYVIETLKDVEFKQFKHNFILMTVFFKKGGYSFNWFKDSAWDAVMHNFKILARIAKESGCKGIWFDAEQYGGTNYWDHKDLKKRFWQSDFNKWEIQIRKRGKEMMQAFSTIFPDGEFVLAFGNSVLTGKIGDSDKQILNKHKRESYALIPAFVDGLIEGSGPDNTIIDACESSYYTREASHFNKWKQKIITQGSLFSSAPKQYSEKIKTSFGLFPTHPKIFNAKNIKQTVFHPEKLRQIVNAALRATDKYVWIWNEKATYWRAYEDYPTPLNPSKEHKGKPASKDTAFGPKYFSIPPIYINALRQAKEDYQESLNE